MTNEPQTAVPDKLPERERPEPPPSRYIKEDKDKPKRKDD